MSGSTQFGTHPDAESLNAFAEQALAGREREQVAAHLAVCARCREVVFLAQGASAELEPELVAAAALTEGRRPWFRNWRLAWIPAAAVAAGISVAYIVHVRHEEPAGQMAQVEKQGTPVEAITQPVPATKSAPAGAESAKKAAAEKRSSKPAAKGHEPVEVAAAPPLTNVNSPVRMNEDTVRSLAGAERESKPARQVATLAAAQAGVVAQSVGVPAEPALETATASAASAPGKSLQAEIRAAPLAKSDAKRVRSPGGSLAALMFKQAGLPSGLAAVSSASVQGYMLAVDSEGSVFLSTDRGLHWESIGRQWSGKAVAVRASAESKVSAKDEEQEGRSGFELVNDRGQVWVSTDGRSWKSK